MQYLLSEEEYGELISRPKKEELIQQEKANTMLALKMLRMIDRKCIHDKDREERLWDCSECPAIQNEKGEVDWNNYQTLCTLQKEFSK